MSAFDPRDLERLAAEVASRPFALSFARTYLRLLPQRVRRIGAATDDGDVDRALEAALSLRVSSAAVGARELVEVSGRIEASLRRGDLAGARSGHRLVTEAAHRAEVALGSFLRGQVTST